jgi:hypothetical protein
MIGNSSAITASITALLAIMGNETESMRRRIDSAEALLTYEAPEFVIERAKGFLTALLEVHQGVRTDHRLEASRLLRKAEAKKIVQQSVRSAESDQWREVGQRMAMARRRMKLLQAGLWPAPTDWADDLQSAPDDPEPAATSG